MELEKNFRVMEHSMKEIMWMEKRKVKDKLCFAMGQNMQENLLKIRSKVSESIIELMESNIKV